LGEISRVMHNYNNFHAQTESVAGPKKIPHRIPNGATKKKKKKKKLHVRKDSWRLTLSKWPSSQNTGELES
jgi:hypothetical protein